MIESDLRTSLLTLCPRVYAVMMPQDVAFPAMTYQVVFDGADQSFNGALQSRTVRIQVDIYAKSYSEAKDLKQQAIAKIVALQGGTISAQDLYDEQSQLHRQLIDFKIKRI